MIFESEYRRQAMERWQASKAESEREISKDWYRTAKSFTSILDRLHSAFVSMFPLSRTRNRF